MEQVQLQENLTIRKKILSMILPITIENVLQMTTGLVLMAMIGRIDAIAVGAIGIANILYRILWGIFKGISTGTSVLVAQAYGANNYKKLKSVTEQSFIISMIISIILQQLLFWLAKYLLLIFNPSSELLANGTIYLKAISYSLPFAAIILLVAGVLQGMGNAKTPMVSIAILNVVNIVFGYIFIFPMNMGLRGAAYAYNIAYIAAALFGIYVLFSKNGVITNIGGRFEFKLNYKEIIAILNLGIPTSFETVFWQAASIFITRAILTYGEIAYAAYQLGLQAESISYMPATGFGIAATTFIGQALGSRDVETGKKYLKQLNKYTIILTIFAGGALTFFPKAIMSILTKDLEVIEIGAMYLVIMGITQLPQNISGVLNGALRGAGYARIPMINAGVGLWCIRVPFILIATYIFKANIVWIWIGIGIDMSFRLLFSYGYFKRKNIWERQALVENDNY